MLTLGTDQPEHDLEEQRLSINLTTSLSIKITVAQQGMFYVVFSGRFQQMTEMNLRCHD